MTGAILAGIAGGSGSGKTTLAEGEIRAQWVCQTEPMYLRHILPTRACAHLVLEFPPPDTRTGTDQIGAIREIVEAALHAP